MPVVAKLRYLRMSPRKLRLVADLIRGKKVGAAKRELRFLKKRAARYFSKLLDSALANAKHNYQLDQDELYLAKVLVDEGPKLKRWRPRARGRAFPIQKKTAHLTLVLEKTATEPKTKEEEGKKGVSLPKKERVRSRKKKFRPVTKEELGKPLGEPVVKRIFRRKAF